MSKKNEEEKNSNFVMMYREHMKEMRWLMQQSGISASIFNFILEKMDYNNALICSNQVFIDYFNISRSTVARSIKLLYDNGFLDIVKSGTSNVYIVNQELAWTSYENQKEYCQFQGNILISALEQSEDYKKELYYQTQFDRLKKLRERENL